MTVNTPWAMILCRFNDVPEINQPREYYEQFLTKSGEGMRGLYDYWRDISRGAISLDGSKVLGWYTMQYSFLEDGDKERKVWMAEARRLAAENGEELSGYRVMVVVNALVDAGASGDYPDMMVLTISAPWGEDNWYCCKNCYVAAYSPDGKGKPSGICAQNLTTPVEHDFTSSQMYTMALNVTGFSMVPGWRHCSQCEGLAYSPDGKPSGVCPTPGPIPVGGATGDMHVYERSGDYSVAIGTPHFRNTKRGWRRCKKCESLVLTAGLCPANGGTHDHSGSGNYTLSLNDPKAVGESGWRRCSQCEGLAYSPDGKPSGICMTGGLHSYEFDSNPIGNYTLSLNDPKAVGESGWRYCSVCEGLAFSLDGKDVGECAGRINSHGLNATTNYTLPINSSTALGDKDWRLCKNCNGLVHQLPEGKCPKKGAHDLTGDTLYSILALKENNMNVTYAAHEMGHCYGTPPLHHAKLDGEDTGYGDHWDVMGSENTFTGTVFGTFGTGLIPPSGRSGPGLCAPNLVTLGWIPNERIFTYNPNGAWDPQEVRLVPLDTPDLSPDDKLAARIITPDCIYYVEFRLKGPRWDQGIPHDGVVIHKVKTLYHIGQKGWKFCTQCKGLVFSPDDSHTGICPVSGGFHNSEGSFDYSLARLGTDVPFPWWYESDLPAPGQFKFCRQCHGLVDKVLDKAHPLLNWCPIPEDAGPFPADRAGPFAPVKRHHDTTGSATYTPPGFIYPTLPPESRAGQLGWRTCSSCGGLIYSPDRSPTGSCPTDTSGATLHTPSTPNYYLPNNDLAWTGPGVKPDGSLDKSKIDPNPFFIPSVPDDDASGWDWRPYQIFRDEKRYIAVRVDSIDVDMQTHPSAKVTIGLHSLELEPEVAAEVLKVENRKLVAAQNASGELQVIVVASLRPDGTSDDIWQKRGFSASPSPGWSDWTRLKTEMDKGISLAAEQNEFNQLEAFAIGTSNDFLRTREEVVGSGDWSEWARLGRRTDRGIGLAVKKRSDNLLEAVAIGTDYEFLHTTQMVGFGVWTIWKTLGKTTKRGISLAVGKRSDGSLEVFAIDMSFNFWHIWQTGLGPDDWSEWTRLGKPTIKGQKLVVSQDKTDRLEAFAIDTSNRVWWKRQNNPLSNDWSDWERLGGGLAWNKAISLAVAPNKDDLLEVFAIDKSYHFWRIWQIDAGGFGRLSWANDWVRLGGQSDRGTTLAVERNGYGMLEAFTIAIDAAGADPSSPKPSDIRHSFQDPITNDWTDWTGL